MNKITPILRLRVQKASVRLSDIFPDENMESRLANSVTFEGTYVVRHFGDQRIESKQLGYGSLLFYICKGKDAKAEINHLNSCNERAWYPIDEFHFKCMFDLALAFMSGHQHGLEVQMEMEGYRREETATQEVKLVSVSISYGESFVFMEDALPDEQESITSHGR